MSDSRIKVMLIEDNPGDARLVREMLAGGGDTQFDLQCHDRLSPALEHLAKTENDVVLLDLSLPDSQGLDTITKVHAEARQMPVVVLTGLDDETLAIEAMHQGAQDYLVKGQLDGNLLTRSIRYAIERHRLMMELEETRQQQLEMKDQFLSRVSHELRTPLAAIHQFITILLDGLAGHLTPEQREYLEIALRNTDQLRTMVADLLEVTRAQIGRLNINPQRVSLAELITETLETFQMATDKVVSLSAKVPGDLPLAYADPDRVRQTLVNLINNAMQFTPENGKITVRAQVYSEDPNYLCVAVADTGCGIGHEEKEQIFKYLYQGGNNIEASRRGLGLGLYISKELVSRQGGRIWVESETGRGSTFYFTVPIFSLPRLLAPILTKGNLRTGSIAVITIELSPVEKRILTKSDETALQEAWNVVHHCIPPSLAVLLPPMPHAESGQVFFIVACVDQSDAEMLFMQIQDHLAHCKGLLNAGLDPVTSYAMLDIPSGNNTRRPDRLTEDTVSRIENLVKTGLKKRQDLYDNQKDSHRR